MKGLTREACADFMWLSVGAASAHVLPCSCLTSPMTPWARWSGGLKQFERTRSDLHTGHYIQVCSWRQLQPCRVMGPALRYQCMHALEQRYRLRSWLLGCLPNAPCLGALHKAPCRQDVPKTTVVIPLSSPLRR